MPRPFAPLPTRLLNPLYELAGLYEQYGSIPRAVGSLISLYIVESLFGLGGYLISSILVVGDYVSSSFDVVGKTLGVSFGTVGVQILRALSEVGATLAGAVARLGPLGPPVAIAIASVGLFAAYRVMIAIAGELPVGSSLVDILGLR